MPIKVTCGACGVSMKTADSSAGKKAKCPKCQAPIVVPMMSEPDPVPEPEPQSQDDLWGGFDQEKEVAAAEPVGEVPGDDRSPCPACGEMIIAGAAKCRYCGEIFDANLAKAERKKSKGGGTGDEDLSVGEWVIAIICSGIGCIAGIVWMIQGKSKGKKMLLVSLAAQGFWLVVRVFLEAIAAAE